MVREKANSWGRRTVAWRAGILLVLASPAWGDALVGSLEAPAGATDYFTVSCSDDGNGAPASLVVSIEDTAPLVAPLVSAQILKGNSATNTTDAIDADAAPSPSVFVDGGTGNYAVFVDKTEDGVETYRLDYACMTGSGGSGVQTGTAITGTEVGTVPALPLFGQLLLTTLVAGLGSHRMQRRWGSAS